MKLVRSFGLLLTTVSILGLLACQGQTGTAKPSVAIASPPHGSAFAEGEVVPVQSAVADAAGISRVELYVDGQMVKQDAPPVSPPPAQFNLIQNWTASGAGTHTITVRAINTAGAFGESGIMITVNAQAAALVATATPSLVPVDTATLAPPGTATPIVIFATPTPGNTPLPSPTVCVPNASFVADVTIPDHTSVAPGASFVKTWRVQNNGNCAWESNYQLVLASGEQMGAPATSPLPAIVPGGTADLTLSMVAPPLPGTHQGNWRLRTASGQIFGTNLTVVIDVPAPTALPTQQPTQKPVGNLPPLEGNFDVVQTGVGNHHSDVHAVLVFEVEAGDINAPCQGDNGCNIDHVDMFIYDSNNHAVYKHTENNVRYCAFGGGDNGADCNDYMFAVAPH